MGDGGMPGPGPGPVTPGETNDLAITINGGRLIISTATGDGIDSNGNMTINGGVVLVTGPTIENNGSLDIGDGQGFRLNVNGGFLVAVASAGMAIAPSDTSTQRSLFVSTQAVGSQPAQTAGPCFPAGTLVHVADGSGKSLLTFRPEQSFASLVFSSPTLAAGSYVVSTGGTSTGAVTDGLFADGAYQGGTARATLALTSGVVAIGRWTP